LNSSVPGIGVERRRPVGWRWLRLAVALGGLCLPGAARAEANAVERGLAWLAARQHASGEFSENAALNALALLAFLSAGQVPDSKPYGTVIERGVRHLLTQQAADGSFTAGGGLMYGHGISTLLLAQVSGMTREDAKVREALERAVDLILRSQAVPKASFHAGGWRYHPNSTDSDLSVSIWQMIALKAASDVGLAVPAPAMERAAAYLRRCEHHQGGFGYQPGGLPNVSRSAAALVTLRVIGQHDDPAIGRSRAWLEANRLQWGDPFYYSASHHLARVHAGFDAAELARRQNGDGSWSGPAESPEQRRGGELYCTAMAIMALTARHNYLPAYLW
jgi:hypothetical protein